MATIISPFLSPRQKYDLVKEAMEQKKPISAVYKGSRRLLCPYILGENAPGEFRTLCFQFRIAEPSDPSKSWRCFSLDQLSDLKFVDERWRYAPASHDPRSQTCMKTVHLKI